MLNINILDDDVLKDIVNNLVSGLLPHENYIPEGSGELMNAIVKYIHVEEFDGQYYALISALNQVMSIARALVDYTPTLEKSSLEIILRSNVAELVRKPEVNMRKILELEGKDTNLDIETNLNEACKLLYVRTLELYDDCFNRKKSAIMSLSFIPAYENAFLSHVQEQNINTMAKILRGQMRIGRVTYTGSAGAFEYSKYCNLEITQRLAQEDENVTKLTDIAQGEHMLDDLAEMFMPMARYLLPPLDDETPILKHRLVVVAANENVGKTKFATHTAGQLLLEGKRVVFMCGESIKGLVLASILSNFIYYRFGICINANQIAKRKQLPLDKQKIISLAMATLIGSEQLVFVNEFNYYTVFEELADIYKDKPFDAVFLDHADSLIGGKTQLEDKTELAKSLRRFKKKYPVYIQLLSHLSSIAKELLSKGKTVDSSPTKGSGAVSAEADDIFVLFTNELLEAQNCLAIQNYKRRNAAKVKDPIIVRRKFSVSTIEYDERIQGSSSSVGLSMDSAMTKVADVYDDVGNDEYAELEGFDEDEYDENSEDDGFIV